MAVQEFWSTLDLKNNMLKNARVEKVDSLPTASEANAGRIVYTGGKFYYSNGIEFVEIADAKVVSDLSTKVTALEGTVGDETKGLVKDVADLKDQVGTDGAGNTLGARVKSLEDSVGKAADTASATGTVYARIAQNKADIAANATAASNANDAATAAQTTASAAKTLAESNQGKITTLEGQVSGEGGLQSKVTALETTVNNETTGLVKKVADNTTAIAAVKKTADAAAVKTEVTAALAGKVDKVEGSDLMTSAEKTKLTGIATGAQVNVIETVKVNNSALTPDGKAVNIDLSGYAKKTDISSAYKAMGSKKFAELPTGLGVENKGEVYNVTDAFKDGDKVWPAGTNVLWTGSEWDPLAGITDLSSYSTKKYVDDELAKKQNNLSTEQLAAVDSGITVTKVGTYDGYSALITAAQNAADAAQTAADGKVAKNADITVSTEAKLVTYDEKGLVTGGRAIAVADVPTGIPVGNITGTLPYAQSPVMVEEKAVEATADTPVTIESGMKTAMIAQVFDSNNNVVFCQTAIAGANVTLTFSASFSGKVRIVGLRV